MRSWLLRHRHALRALYGLPPEARIARLLAAREEPSSPPEPAPDGSEARTRGSAAGDVDSETLRPFRRGA